MQHVQLQEIVSLSSNIAELELPKNTCLYYSALLYATLVDNTDFKPRFVAGSVKILDDYVFKLDKNTPLNLKNNLSMQWNGHTWVEINNLIVDLSLFKSIKALG